MNNPYLGSIYQLPEQVLPEPDQGGVIMNKKGKTQELTFATKEEMDAYDA